MAMTLLAPRTLQVKVRWVNAPRLFEHLQLLAPAIAAHTMGCKVINLAGDNSEMVTLQFVGQHGMVFPEGVTFELAVHGKKGHDHVVAEGIFLKDPTPGA